MYYQFSFNYFSEKVANTNIIFRATRKRKHFAENPSLASEEMTVGEYLPLAPLAKLDSLQEMVK